MSVVTGEDDEEEMCQAISVPAAAVVPVPVSDASINDSNIQSVSSCESSSATMASASSDAISDTSATSAVSVSTEQHVTASTSASAGMIVGTHDSLNMKILKRSNIRMQQSLADSVSDLLQAPQVDLLGTNRVFDSCRELAQQSVSSIRMANKSMHALLAGPSHIPTFSAQRSA